MRDEALPLAPPSRVALWGELRVLRDLALMLPALRQRVPVAARLAAASPVLVLPGYGAGDVSTYPLRRHLARHGVACEGWGLGLNRAGLNLKHTLLTCTRAGAHRRKIPTAARPVWPFSARSWWSTWRAVPRRWVSHSLWWAGVWAAP